MTRRPQSGFRFVPWRLSWKRFALVFLAFVGVNYAIVRYCSKHPLLGTQDANKPLNSIERALNDQSLEIQDLRRQIKQLRIRAADQRTTIQAMEQTLDVAGGKLGKLSLRLNTLRHSNDEVDLLANNQEKTILEIEKSLVEVKMDLQEVRNAMAKAGLKP